MFFMLSKICETKDMLFCTQHY